MIIYSEHYTTVKKLIRQNRSCYGQHEAKRVHNEDFISWFANKFGDCLWQEREEVCVHIVVCWLFQFMCSMDYLKDKTGILQSKYLLVSFLRVVVVIVNSFSKAYAPTVLPLAQISLVDANNMLAIATTREFLLNTVPFPLPTPAIFNLDHINALTIDAVASENALAFKILAYFLTN
ncbi:hypothetical protein M5K25_001900 [Dendrobium thyrsiflorum]|uniref:Uncharacterized protein n=1 Tax=Dendrobium thyrsiflorum TaxID=117978 RepID=A0ABD0VRJ5_DENTH